MKIKFALAALLLLTACGEKSSPAGQWMQSIPGMAGQFQGMLLKENGEARSINMHTLIYEKWEKDGNRLILKGKSIGNGQTVEFDLSYVIKQLDAQKLILNNGGEDLVFIKRY